MGVRVFREQPWWGFEDVSLQSLLASVSRGDIQRPGFCRPWKWRGDNVTDLVETVLQHGPIGTLTLVSWDESLSLAPLALPGTGEAAHGNRAPSWLVVDGQQRLVALHSALVSRHPMKVPTENGEAEHRLHFLDICKVLDDQVSLRDAILAVRVLADGSPASAGAPDLREPAQHFASLLLPTNRMFDFHAWERECVAAWREE